MGDRIDEGFKEPKMSRKLRRERRSPPSPKPRIFPATPRRSPGAPARSANYYRRERYIPAIMAAERGIYESFMISERKLTDVEVGHALRQLTQELLEQGFQAVEDPHEVTLGEKA